MSKFHKYEDHWPKTDVDLHLITGAMENGSDLFLIGSFGGFGGTIHYVHKNLEKAKAHAQEMNNIGSLFHVKVYRMKFELEDDMLGKTKESDNE